MPSSLVLSPDVLRALETVPDPYLVLAPDEDFTILTASDAYLSLTSRRRADLQGQPLLGAFPQQARPGALGTEPLLASLRQALSTRQPHALHQQRYDVLTPDGGYQEKYWDILNTPVVDAAGTVQYLLNRAVDRTAQVLDQARVEARLAAHDRQLRQVLTQAPAAVATLQGPEHRYTFFNARYQALVGGRAQLGARVADVLPELAEVGLIARLDQVLGAGQAYEGLQTRLRLRATASAPAQERYVDVTYQPLWDADEQVTGVLVFAVDVTQRALEQQQRAAQQQQLHALFQQAPTPICIVAGPAMVFELVNPAYQAIFPGRELLGQPLLAALPEFADSPLPGLLQHVYQTGETYVAQELPLQLPAPEGTAGEQSYWSFTYQARRAAQGLIDGVFVFLHEVTAQVRARRVVEAREESFRLMADNVPAMLWVTDPQGQCTYLNQPWVAFTTQPTAEGLGRGWLGALHPDDAEAAGAAFLDANARRAPFQTRFRLRRHDGQYRWVTDTGRPRFSAAGAYAGMVGSLVDVHEQQLAERAQQRLTAELQTANEQLTRVNVDLDTFVYTASHDLKAPISNIEGLLHLLKAQLPPLPPASDVPPVLGMLDQAVARFHTTLGHLSEAMRVHSSVPGEPAMLVEVAAVVADVRLDLQPLLATTQAQIEVDVAAGSRVSFAPKNLRSVVYNLLSNALKYRHPDRPPLVRVRCRAQAEYTVLSVQDNGLGFNIDHQAQLFGLFQRLHTHVEGSGVGLYMIRRLVENAGGRMEVESEVGVGSTFRVYFLHAA